MTTYVIWTLDGTINPDVYEASSEEMAAKEYIEDATFEGPVAVTKMDGKGPVKIFQRAIREIGNNQTVYRDNNGPVSLYAPGTK